MKATLDRGPKVDSERITSCTTAAPREPHAIAAKLARVAGVIAVYASDSPSLTRIWMVLLQDDDATLDAVFHQELALHDDYGDQRASVEFHVLSQDAARSLALGDKIYERAD